MKLTDFSPSKIPTPDEQRDALRKGLGRAVLWASSGQVAEAVLLEACLVDQRYDCQIDDARAPWLWQMIEHLQAQERFREPILKALREKTSQSDSETCWDANQLFQLGCCFAKTGDDKFRSTLYDIIRLRPFPNDPDFGERDLLELDGFTALTVIASIRGNELLNRKWEWEDQYFTEKASEIFGESATKQHLQAASEPALKRFLEHWEQPKKQPSSKSVEPTRQQRLQSIPLSEILAEAKNEQTGWALFRSWGIYADELDLNLIVDHLCEATEPAELISLLRIFSKRAIPRFETRLLQFSRHPTARVRESAIAALSTLADPAIRATAIDLLQEGNLEAICLFNINFVTGDEALILAQLDPTGDCSDDHAIHSDIIEMLEQNDHADPSQLALFVYAQTGCGHCRTGAVRRLIQRQCAPEWLIEECHFDSELACRNLVNQQAENR